MKDEELEDLLRRENEEYLDAVDLIAASNAPTVAVRENCTWGVAQFRSAEGYAGRRPYAGTRNFDAVEDLARRRAMQVFRAEYANMQPHSGTAANLASYRAVMTPGQTLLTLSMPSGGHFSHGHPKHVSGSTYNIVHYELDPVTLQLDYADIRKQAFLSGPAAIVAGYSAYPRQVDFAAFASIADEVDAVLIADISHVAGLVAAGLYPNPCEVGALVTMSVEKTLRGTRGGVILCPTRLADAVDSAVFPGLQSSIGMAGLVSVCALLNEVGSEGYVDYHRRTLAYAHLMAESLISEGLRIISGGTDTHLLMIDLRDQGLTGQEAEGRLASLGILSNRNLVPGDQRSGFVTSGLRLGTATIAARGWTTGDVYDLSKVVAATLLAPIWPNSDWEVWRARIRTLTSQRRDNDSLADLVAANSIAGSSR
ncbi:MAG: serine hydroxymethyltransferase [Pseudonocardiaceae bacterium]